MTRRHFKINWTRRRVDSMNWRDEKRTRRHVFATRRDEHFVQELTPYNRPFYRYGGHIELIRFKEYYRMPKGHEQISFVYFQALFGTFFGKISVQVPTSLCIQLLFWKNNRSKNGRPLGATGFVLLTLRFFFYVHVDIDEILEFSLKIRQVHFFLSFLGIMLIFSSFYLQI